MWLRLLVEINERDIYIAIVTSFVFCSRGWFLEVNLYSRVSMKIKFWKKKVDGKFFFLFSVMPGS